MTLAEFVRNETSERKFGEWMRRVDEIIYNRCYVGAEDLPDCTYRDWYDDGMTPKKAAGRAIKNARE
jgi:hypothetical protein